MTILTIDEKIKQIDNKCILIYACVYSFLRTVFLFHGTCKIENSQSKKTVLHYMTYYNKERTICARTQNAFPDYPETHFHYLRYCLISKAAHFPNRRGIPSLSHRH